MNHRVPLGGAALAAVAAFAYLNNPKAAKDQAKKVESKTPSLPAVAEETEQLGKKVGQQVSEQANKTMKEMSGRQKTDQGSFRHD